MIDTVFTILFFVGALGLVVMLLLGGLHFGHGHSGHSSHSAKDGGASHGSRPSRSASRLLGTLSPMTLFGLSLGAGATGLLVRSLHLASIDDIAAAVAGGLAFQMLAVRPMLSLIVRFGSTPSAGLAGALAQDAEVLTPFDASGHGLVKLTVDGQLVRALATLESDDRAASGALAPGDIVTVTAVDATSNSCRVARI